MDHIGIDVHKKESQICILAEGRADRTADLYRAAALRRNAWHADVRAHSPRVLDRE